MAITVYATSCPAHLPAVFLTPQLPILFSDALSPGVQRRTGIRHSCSWDGVSRLQAELKDRRFHPGVSQPFRGSSLVLDSPVTPRRRGWTFVLDIPVPVK